MPSDGRFEIVHRDRHLLVVTKPSGLATTAPDGGDCLTRRVQGKVRGRVHPTSRLDAEVTGLVTFALTKRAIAALRAARQQGQYGRGYLGLATAAPEPAEGDWRWSIAIDPKDRRLRVAVPEGGSGERLQEAWSRYRVRALARGEGGDVRGVALWLTPHTGRTHQLRVHAAAAGAPLLGDTRYGGAKRVVLADGRVVTARRTMLHCAWLRLPRVVGDGELELSAEAPADLRELWERLGGEGGALAPRPAG
jgi:23S rRNA-/tRNA-specific pseudouridylate synthase